MSLFEKKIYHINNEIDYNKLAEAIVNAEEKKKAKENEEFKKAKLSWGFWLIIVLSIIAGIYFLLLSISAIILGEYIDALKTFMFVLGDVFLIVASVFIGKTKDKNYIIGLGGLVFSFVSIVITVVTYGG